MKYFYLPYKKDYLALPTAQKAGNRIKLYASTSSLFNCLKEGVSKDLLPADLLAQAKREIQAHKQKYSLDIQKPNLRLYQSQAIEWLKVFKRGLLAMSMGAGKTRTVLTLIKDECLKRILILAPVSVLNVWVLEAKKIGLDYPIFISHSLNTKKKQEQFKNIFLEDFFIVVTSYESAWRPKIKPLLLKQKWDLICLDEGHKIQGAGSKCTRFCHLVAKKNDCYKIILTGTPKGRSYEAYYSMFKFLDPGMFGTNKDKFLEKYAIMSRHNKYVVAKWLHQEELKKKIHYLIFRVSKEEALPFLPERNDVILYAHLPPAILSKYNELKQESVTEIDDTLVGARNVLAKYQKLQQFAQGFLTEESQILDVHKAKLKVLEDFLDSFDDSHLVIFYWFQEDQKRIEKFLKKKKVKYFYYTKDKKELHKWNKRGGILLAQLKVASLGIDLTASRTALYYDLTYDWRVFIQSKDRLHRPPQKRKVFYYYILVKNTKDEECYRLLKEIESDNIQDLDIAKQIIFNIKNNLTK